MGKIPRHPEKITHREAILWAPISCKNGCPAKHGSGKHRAAILWSQKNCCLANKWFAKHGPNQRPAKIPHKNDCFANRYSNLKKSSSCGFVILWGHRLAGHHCRCIEKSSQWNVEIGPSFLPSFCSSKLHPHTFCHFSGNLFFALSSGHLFVSLV